MKKSLLLIATLMFCVSAFAEVVTIGEGTEYNTVLPTNSLYNYSLSQQIYLADEIGTGGTICSVAFYNGGGQRVRNIDLYMAATQKDAFANANEWANLTAADKLFSGEVLFNENTWTTITLATPFVYDGTSNLVLTVDDNTGSWQSGLQCLVFAAPYQSLRIYNDGTNYDPVGFNTTGTILNVKNQIKLEINSETNAIQQVEAPQVPDGIRYNVMGQPVGKDYKGIVIENGKKIVVR